MKKILSIIMTLLLILGTMFCFASTAFAADSIATATTVTLGRTYEGSITANNKVDYYKFVLNTASRVNVSVKSEAKNAWVSFYYADGSQMVKGLVGDYHIMDNGTGLAIGDYEFHLTKGTYYLKVETFNSVSLGYCYGDYTFVINSESSGVTLEENHGGSNNNILEATNIDIGKTYKAQIDLNDRSDFYKFSVSGATDVKLKLTYEIKYFLIYLYDENGKEIYNNRLDGDNEVKMFNETFAFKKGIYYLKFDCFKISGGDYCCGPYSFSLTSDSINTPGESDAYVEKVIINDFVVMYKDSYKIAPKVEVKGDVDYTATYTSSNPDVVTVDKNGIVSTNYRGTATITCTVTDEFGNEVEDTCIVEVKLRWWQWIIWILLWGWAWY